MVNLLDRTGFVVRSLSEYASGTSEVAFSPEGDQIAMTADDVVRVLRVSTGELLHEIRAKSPSAVAIAKGGAALAYVEEGDVVFVDLTHGAPAGRVRHVGAREIVFNDAGDVLLAKTEKTGVFLIDRASLASTAIDLPPKIINAKAFVARDLAAAVTPAVVSNSARLVAALARAGNEPVAFSIAPDLSLVARASGSIALERVADGAVVTLEAVDFGGPIELAFDERGAYDGDAAALARIHPGASSPGQRAGLLAAFARGAR